MTASPMANDLVVQRAGLPTDRPADLGEGGSRKGSMKAVAGQGNAV